MHTISVLNAYNLSAMFGVSELNLADLRQNSRICEDDHEHGNDDSWVQFLCDDGLWTQFQGNNDLSTSLLCNQDNSGDEHHEQASKKEEQKQQHNLLQILPQNNFLQQFHDRCISDHPVLPFGGSSTEQLQERRRKRKRKEDKEISAAVAPVVAFRTRSETTKLEDGFRWQKYGTKLLKRRINPRYYYKCAEDHCDVKKKVEKDPEDEGVVITTYEGTHNHLSPYSIFSTAQHLLASAGSAQKPVVVFFNASSIRL